MGYDMRKSYLFDLDFTTLSYSFYPGVFSKIIEFYGLDFLTPDDLRRMLHRKSLELYLNNRPLESHDWDLILEIILKQNGIKPTKNFTEFVIEDVTERGAPITKGALRLFDTIKQENGVIGILTNGFKRYQKIKVEVSGISELVDFIIYIDDVGTIKPYKEFFNYAIKYSMQLKAEPVAYVGDNFYFDVIGALNSGIRNVVWYRKKGDYKMGKYKISELTDIFNKVVEVYNHQLPEIDKQAEIFVANNLEDILEFGFLYM